MKEKWKIDHEVHVTILEEDSEEFITTFMASVKNPERYQVCLYVYDKTAEDFWSLKFTMNGEDYISRKTPINARN